MIKLQYWDEEKWIDVSSWNLECMAWASLGKDNYNYRTLDEGGNVLTTITHIDFYK